MPVEIKPSSPEFAEVDAHMYALNVLLNPQMFFDGKGIDEVPELEKKALIATIKKSIQEVIDEP